MQPFRFRAAAALVMRRQQEDTARQQLSAAEIARNRAEDHARTTAEAAGCAREAAADACRTGTESGPLAWHQSWIVRKQLEAEAGRRAAAVSTEAAGRAAAAVRLAYQRRRALERLRDRMWQRHRLEAGRRELRDMNDLATLRYRARPDDD